MGSGALPIPYGPEHMHHKRTLAPEKQDPSKKKKKSKQQQGGQGREQTAAGGKDPVSETEWRPPPLPVPDTTATLLDTQIRSLAQLIGSTDDGQGRKAALVRITRLVRKTLSGGQARLIGSAALGLALPTSDVDLTVLGRSEAGRRADLDALQAAVQSSGLGRRCLVIHAKKVSILKFVEAQSGLSTDLSVAVPGGLTTLAWMRSQLAERPSLHPLLLVLKLSAPATLTLTLTLTLILSLTLTLPLIRYLKQNGWDDPAYGGLGSYLLFVIVRDATSHSTSADLGDLLLEVLRRWPRETDASRNHMLNVLDPCDAANNLGRTFSNHRAVRDDLSARLGSLSSSASPCLSQLLAQWPLSDADALRAASRPARPRAQGFGGFGGGAGRGKGGKGSGMAGKGSGKGWGKGKSGGAGKGKGKGKGRGDWGGAGRVGGAAPLKTIAKVRRLPWSTSVVSH